MFNISPGVEMPRSRRWNVGFQHGEVSGDANAFPCNGLAVRESGDLEHSSPRPTGGLALGQLPAERRSGRRAWQAEKRRDSEA